MAELCLVSAVAVGISVHSGSVVSCRRNTGVCCGVLTGLKRTVKFVKPYEALLLGLHAG